MNSLSSKHGNGSHADLEARGSSAVMDEDFAHDIEEGIKAQRQPWIPPSWD
jgi:hypothetical protein